MVESCGNLLLGCRIGYAFNFFLSRFRPDLVHFYTYIYIIFFSFLEFQNLFLSKLIKVHNIQALNWILVLIFFLYIKLFLHLTIISTIECKNKSYHKVFYLPFRTTTDEFEDETFKDTGKIKYFFINH